MTIRIFKYPIRADGVVIDHCKRVLSVQMQGGKVMAWAEVDDRLSARVEIAAFPTGGMTPTAGGWRYIGTVVGIDGWIVSHFYARGEPSK